MILTKKQKEIIDKAIEEDKNIVILGGGRNMSKSYIQQYIMTKKWPVGLVAHISAKGVTTSELANAEEIKE